MAAERYLSWRIPDLRVGNNIDKIDKKPILQVYIRGNREDLSLQASRDGYSSSSSILLTPVALSLGIVRYLIHVLTYVD